MLDQTDTQRPRPALKTTACGIGLRHPHLGEVAQAGEQQADFLEVHAENYFGSGAARAHLSAIAATHPLSIHGVGLSLGSAEGIDSDHLAQFAGLVDDLRPALVSDHLAWCREGGRYLNDLLPLPYTAESLGIVAENIDRVQQRIGRRLLIENPSSYLEFQDSPLREADFLAALVVRSGCGLLLDLNNLHVSASNHGWYDLPRYWQALPADAISEVHLAGHTVKDIDGQTFLIDSHDGPVAEAVLTLWQECLDEIGPRPTLLEWDSAIPPLADLRAEADRLRQRMPVP